ncbi:MAG: transposase [Candidatus Marinimicrobia bacterium CG08_land_8_20_14_0_20_45_22]|nr:MAG: transposase [Candidatus Marinimicrobia bacterium CG08_land_8_20_14_0_20_45_22]
MPYIRVWIHLIWSTKNREKLISPSLKSGLLVHLHENASEKEIFLSELNCMEEHCHALVSLGCTQTISKIMQLIKGESAHWINDNHLVRGHFEWQDEYIAVSVSESQIGKVRNYIQNQEIHHKKKTFAQEYDEFIKKYGFIKDS